MSKPDVWISRDKRRLRLTSADGHEYDYLVVSENPLILRVTFDGREMGAVERTTTGSWFYRLTAFDGRDISEGGFGNSYHAGHALARRYNRELDRFKKGRS